MGLMSRVTCRRLCAALSVAGQCGDRALRCPMRTSSTAAPAEAARVITSPAQAWDGALRSFYDALGGVSGSPAVGQSSSSCSSSGTALRLHDVHEKAVLAMRCCLQSGRFQEAVDVHTAACRCGLLPMATSGCQTGTGEGTALLDVLALAATRHLPFCVRQSKTMLFLLDAEEDQSLQAQHPLLDARDTSAVELFRISLHQRLHVLRTTDYLSKPLGHQYVLAAMREVGESPVLRADIEPLPLVQLSRLALWHPLAFETPTTASARRQRHFDVLGAHRFDAVRFTVAEQRQLRQLSDTVTSIRPLCTSSVALLSALVPDWDAVFLRRVAETLVLPETAHNVFPAAYATTRRRAGAGPSAANAVSLTNTAWLDGRLFREESADTETAAPTPPRPTTVLAPYHPLQRLERILKRRAHQDIVVPDPHFLITHLQQLLQLARHREVVITHGVLLEVVDLACASEDPRRFHARRVLLCLLQRTSSSAAADAPGAARIPPLDPPGRHPSGARRRWQQTCGVTLLGLQDELALLEHCPERFFLADHSGRSEGTGMRHVPGLSAGGRRGGREEAGVLSALLVAKQLHRVVTSHARGCDFWRDAVSRVDPNPHSNMDELVQGILDNAANVDDTVPGPLSHVPRSPEPAPLFKQRSRSYWSHAPIVVATTSPTTRSTAFGIGIEMYPPVVVN